MIPVRRSGFTLLEIVVTLGLLGLVFAAATVRFNAMFRTSRLEAGGRGLGDHFAFAVSRAYTTGAYHTLVFDLAAGRYGILPGREDQQAGQLLKRRLPKGVAITDIQVGYDLYAAPGTLAIEISPLGVTNDVLINLEDERGAALAVSLNALVQRVEYFDAYTTYEELNDVPAR